jgi:Zn-dependent peptidase ImmA (M78 family)
MRDDNRMPVDPALITWARERSGFSLKEVKAKQGFEKIQDWEGGTLYPTYPQVEKMAILFHIPTAVFFFPVPPTVPQIDETFRTLPHSIFQGIPSRVRFLLRKARALQISLSELHGGRNPASNFITRDISMTSPRDIPTAVRKVRDYLNISVQEQFHWPGVDDALEHWRDVLIDHGVYVFKDAFLENDFFGFCLYDEEFPIIYVNNSSAKSRQVFTIFHELAHLLFRTSGIDHHESIFDMRDFASRNRRIEISCNDFAGRFLVPDDDLDELVDADTTVHDARRIARWFSVSTEVILRKLLDRTIITQVEYEAEVSRSNLDSKGQRGGHYYHTQITYLGKKYVRWALQGYHQGRFDDLQLAEYLDIQPKNITKFEDSFLRLA